MVVGNNPTARELVVYQTLLQCQRFCSKSLGDGIAMPQRPATIFGQRGRGDPCTSLDRRFDVATFPPPRFCARSSQIGSLGVSALALAACVGRNGLWSGISMCLVAQPV